MINLFGCFKSQALCHHYFPLRDVRIFNRLKFISLIFQYLMQGLKYPIR